VPGEIHYQRRRLEGTFGGTAEDFSCSVGGAIDSLYGQADGLRRGSKGDVVFFDELAGDEGNCGASVAEGIHTLILDSHRAARAVVIFWYGFCGGCFQEDILVFVRGFCCGDPKEFFYKFRFLWGWGFHGCGCSSWAVAWLDSWWWVGACRCGCRCRGASISRGVWWYHRGCSGWLVGRCGGADKWGWLLPVPSHLASLVEDGGDFLVEFALGVMVAMLTTEGAGDIAGPNCVSCVIARGAVREGEVGQGGDHVSYGTGSSLVGQKRGGDWCALSIAPEFDV
jgi:hypothetical protein